MVVERPRRAVAVFDEPPLGRRLGGCLLRLVVFVLVLLLLLAGVVFLLGRAL